MTTPTYTPVAFADVKHGDTIRATHAASGSVLVGKALGPLRTGVRVGVVAGDDQGVYVGQSSGWSVEREDDLSHVPTRIGRYMRADSVDSIYNGTPIYNFDGSAWYQLDSWARGRIGGGEIAPADLPRDLVRLVPAPATLDTLVGAPAGDYLDKDGDIWRVRDDGTVAALCGDPECCGAATEDYREPSDSHTVWAPFTPTEARA
jgi:hypothetical protein